MQNFRAYTVSLKKGKVFILLRPVRSQPVNVTSRGVFTSWPWLSQFYTLYSTFVYGGICVLLYTLFTEQKEKQDDSWLKFPYQQLNIQRSPQFQRDPSLSLKNDSRIKGTLVFIVY